ncbi:tetratricopeptide repeat protein [Salinibacter altiplanensis]|uniref:tetratricopeptide repeat protein n=1 Tax=Salinibacter altiplanensis TaxID=1803181 RepID=UPI00131A4EB1|nr:tetratricopeptide repeat protein [Salinibacter altiplanensis]
MGCESDLARRVGKYEQTRDYESAAQLLQRATQRNSQDAEAHFLLGRVQVRRGAYEDAVAALETSRELSPRFEEQIEFLREKHGREEFQEGKEADQSGSHQAAIQHYRNATLLLPDDAAAHRALGHTLVQADQAAEAEKAYQEALDLEPDAETLNNLAALAFRRGAYAETVRYSQRALGLDPETARQSRPEVVERLAYAHLRLDQFSAAKERFREALSTTPSEELRRDFAFALHQRGEYEEARSQLETLAAAQTPDRSVLHVLGDTYLALGKHHAATETYRRLYQQHPEDEDALQSLIIAYHNLDQDEEAQKYTDQLKELTDDDNR